MAALDTNVLIRFLVQDHAAQSTAARKLARKCVNEGQTLFVPVTVSLELALLQYAKTSADYSDCLHAALATAANSGPLWTFDKAAAKVDGAKLLTASP